METRQNKGDKPTKTLLTITQLNAMLDNDEIDLEGKGFIITSTAEKYGITRQMTLNTSRLDLDKKVIFQLLFQSASRGMVSVSEQLEKANIIGGNVNADDAATPTPNQPNPKI